MTVRRSLLITLSQSYVTLGLQFITSLIIARLLTPAELGVFSVAMVLTAIANTLRDFGVVEYVVQEKTLNTARLRAALLLTFMTAWSMAALILLLAGPSASFYRQPDVTTLLAILSLNFFLLPFGSVVAAHMRRQLEFTRIALIRTAVAAVNAAAAVTLAYLGFSYFSLAWALVLASVTHVGLILLSRPKGFPALPGVRELRRVFSFGSFSSLNQILKDLDKGAPDLVLGRLMGMDTVAYFGRAAGLIDLFNRLVMQAVETIALPLLSAQVRNREDLTQPYLTSVTYLTGIAWPFYLFVGLSAGPLIGVLYGDQWTAAIPVVQVLCLGEALIVPFYLQHQMSISQGLVRREVLRNSLSLLARLVPLLLLPAFGLDVVAAGYAGSFILVAVVNYLFLRTVCGARLRALWKCMLPSLVLTAMVAVPLTLTAFLMASHQFGHGERLMSSLAILAVTWLLGTRLVRHPWLADLRQAGITLAETLRERRGRHG